MKFFTSKIHYSILAGLAAYGTYRLFFDIIGIGAALQNCNLSDGTITVICYISGMA